MHADFDACYRAVASRDGRFDGRFFTGVLTTGIYCRPICPARTPRAENVRFFGCAAAAQEAGFRACLRCRPDASPGSPTWDTRGDLVGRALRLISDGVVDDEGVAGLARRLAVGERHLRRLLVAELGASPLALARARRLHLARLLIDDTDLSLTDVAFAAGFSSVRAFNASVQAGFGRTPTDLRRRAGAPAAALGGSYLTLRLPYREPYAADPVFAFLAARAVPGVEEVRGHRYRRVVARGEQLGVLEVEAVPDAACLALRVDRDALDGLGGLVQRVRRLFDLCADPAAIDGVLGADPFLAPSVAARPGLRVPGAVDGFELAVRAVLGQQVSVAAATTAAGRLARRFGRPLTVPRWSLTHAFPTPAAFAEAPVEEFALPRSRAVALQALARAVAEGALDLDAGADRDETVRRLLALPGVGPWTASYIALRALRDPDALPVGDLVLRRALGGAGAGRPREVTARTERWRPWRAYGLLHLWSAAASPRIDAEVA